MKKTFLILLDHQTAVKKIPLNRGRTVIGRGDDVDLVLSSGEVSRHHAAVEYDGHCFMLVDLDSTNGTFINGKKITKRKISIGEKITIGDHTLVIDDGRGGFFYPEETAAARTGKDTVILKRKFAALRRKLASPALNEEFRTIEQAVQKSRRRLSDRAHIDKLTGLFNRHYFEERARRELAGTTGAGAGIAFLFIDIDHFKKINDTHGHAQGDVILASIARLIQVSCRKSDIVARYGGEEIVVMLPDTSSSDARIVAHGINRLIREQSRSLMGMRVTVSIGIATYPAHGTELEAIIAAADRALYRAKQAGRDTVSACDEE